MKYGTHTMSVALFRPEHSSQLLQSGRPQAALRVASSTCPSPEVLRLLPLPAVVGLAQQEEAELSPEVAM